MARQCNRLEIPYPKDFPGVYKLGPHHEFKCIREQKSMDLWNAGFNTATISAYSDHVSHFTDDHSFFYFSPFLFHPFYSAGFDHAPPSTCGSIVFSEYRCVIK